MKRLYSTTEVAHNLHVLPTTVTKWIREGKMAARKIGRSYMISDNSLKAFLGDIDAYFQTLVEAVPEK